MKEKHNPNIYEARYFQLKKEKYWWHYYKLKYIWTWLEMVHIILTILFIKGAESLSSRRLLREHFKIIWRDVLASYRSSRKQISYIRKKSTQEKKVYKWLKNDIKSGTESLTPLPGRNNKGRNPIYFSKGAQKRTYDLSAWSKSVLESVYQGAWVAQSFICITGLNLVLCHYLLIKSSATYSHWLWAVSVSLSEMEQMRVWGFFAVVVSESI